MFTTNVVCPKCRITLKSSKPIPVGQRVNCKQCGTTFAIPAQDISANTPAPAKNLTPAVAPVVPPPAAAAVGSGGKKLLPLMVVGAVLAGGFLLVVGGGGLALWILTHPRPHAKNDKPGDPSKPKGDQTASNSGSEEPPPPPRVRPKTATSGYFFNARSLILSCASSRS